MFKTLTADLFNDILFQSVVHPSMPFCILSVMSFVASASIMRLPETGGEDLANTLEEGEDFGRDQSFVKVLFVERRRKKSKALLKSLGLANSGGHLPSNQPIQIQNYSSTAEDRRKSSVIVKAKFRF